MINDYHSYITQWFYSKDQACTCPYITFQVTDDCCLACSYCYQINKGHKMMTKEVARAGLDLLLRMYDENKADSFINHHTVGVILEFIGGEPFMNIEVIEDATEYWINKLITLNHPWLTNFRISIASNGLLYFDEQVQHYLEKYKPFISLTISIDGPKELHDSCRKDHDGKGSFERSFAAWLHWRDHGNSFIDTKATFAPENLPYMNEIIQFFMDNGAHVVYANPIYEADWTTEQAKMYYDNLIILADKLLAKPNILYTNLFEENIGNPLPLSDTKNYCGGGGAMLAFDPEGIAYPCLRYMESSLGNDCEPIIIGTVQNIYTTPAEQDTLKKLQSLNRIDESDEECLNCPIASGCGECLAWNYQKYKCFNKKAKGICWMHRARVLANVYYWNKYYIQNNINKCFFLGLPRNIATQIISNEEYDKLLMLAQNRG